MVLDLQDVQRTRKQVLAVVLVLVSIGMLFTRSYWPAAGSVHEAIETLGVGAVIACIMGRVWCSLYIGGRKKAEIVRDGPYSVSRNPLYFFSILGAAGVGAALGSITLAVAFAGICYWVFRTVVAKEERFLAERFGADYEAYLRDVPRFLPDPRLWRDAVSLTVTPRLVVRTLLDSSLFLLAFPAFEFVEWAQSSGALSILLILP